MDFNQNLILQRVMLFIPVLLSLSVHECAHAWTAWRLGDDTARLLGRMTLNPIAHIDPIGTLLLPLMGVPFGWAKPVPVNPLRFTRRVSMSMGSLLVSVAGPLSNVAIALLCTVVLGVLVRYFPGWYVTHAGPVELLWRLVLINCALALFNLLPIPPLDGHWIADALMPRSLRPEWENFCRLGPFVLAAVIVLPSLAGHSLLDWPLEHISAGLSHLLYWLAG